jgi:protein O-mannosyl-transferase
MKFSFSYFFFQYQLRSIGILGIAIATILHLRLSISGPVTQFSTADNPTAKANTILTRFYTFLYLPVFNFKLLVYPHTLSFDWGMDAIPRITSLLDGRNIISMMFYSFMCRIAVKCTVSLRQTVPKLISSKRLGRTIQKRKHQNQMHSKSSDDAMTVQSNQLWSSESGCLVCKQGLKYRHVSSCRSSGNVGFTAASLCTVTNAGKKHVISLSPLKKYIRNNNSIYLNNCNNNGESAKDNNNNNLCVVDNNYNASLQAIAPLYHQTTKHCRTDNQPKTSVKSLSKKLACLAEHFKSAEQSVKQTKLNSASATLISITILTLPFLPASNLFFYVGFVVAERILYLPSVGYCLLIGLGLGKLINFKVQPRKGNGNGGRSRLQKTESLRRQSDVRSMAAILFLIILISACSLKTIRRNRDWRDEESLYRSAIKVNPPKGM